MKAALLNSAASFAHLPLDPITGRININAMRPYIDENGDRRIVVNSSGATMKTNAPALLRYDEWKDIDRTVLEVATQRLVGIQDLISRSLTYSLGSIGQTISLWDRSSDMTPADVSMSGITKGEEDNVQFESQTVPVPIIHKDFRINIRRLEASRLFGAGVDVIQADIAARRVSEASEDMLFNGYPIQVDGGTIYGYRSHPHRNTVDLATPWNDPSITGQDIYDDVEAMIASARADRYYGPYCLYVPGAYEGVLDRDFAGSSGDIRTIRQRLLQISGLEEIKVVDRLEEDNVILVQLTRDVVDLAIAQDISTLNWQVDGGMQEKFKVMAVWVPRIKSDFDGRSGIVHLRPA